MAPAGESLASLRSAVAERALSPETDEALNGGLELLRAAAGETLDGVIFFGSRRTNAARANAFSAYDLFLVVPSYRAFYRALVRAGLSSKNPFLLALVSTWLPPTQISLRIGEVLIKGAVLTRAILRRETSGRRRDHFTIGRLFQPARVLLARTPELRELLLDALVSAHFETWRWSRPWLPPAFDADAYGQRVLEVSMGWEIRPEPPGRAAALWAAQRDLQRPVFDALLEGLEATGELRRLADDAQPEAGPLWAPVRAPSLRQTLALRVYFSASIARATLRWAKHVVSFEGWLDYIVRKASRHSGQSIELSERERRWPLLFLWGRVFRYLRDKNRKGAVR